MKTIYLIFLTTILALDLHGQAINWEQVYEDDGFALSNSIEDILPIDDNGYLLLGTAFYQNATNLQFIHLIRTDEAGNALWKKYLNKDEQNLATWQRGHSIVALDDGNFIIGGTKDFFWTQDTLFMIKINIDGDTLWTNDYIGNYTRTSANRMIRVDDALYFIGNAYDEDETYTLLVKTDLEGNMIWQSQSLTTVSTSEGFDIIAAADGNLVSTGIFQGNISLTKTNPEGDIIWQQSYALPEQEQGLQVIENDLGFLIGGGAWPGDTLRPILVQTDQNGELLWEKTLTNIEGLITGLHLKADGNVAATTSLRGFGNEYLGGQGFFLTLNTDGDIIAQTTLLSNGTDIEPTPDGGYLTAGGTAGQFSIFSYLTKLGGIIDAVDDMDDLSDAFTVFPNPVIGQTLHITSQLTTSTSIDFKMMNALGKTVLEGQIQQGQNNIALPQLPVGEYLIGFYQQQSQIGIQKVVLAK